MSSTFPTAVSDDEWLAFVFMFDVLRYDATPIPAYDRWPI
jgi:hypothetical protein